MILSRIPLPRDAVAWFSGEMEKRLRLHDATRGPWGWASHYLTDLHDRINNEADELLAILVDPKDYPGSRPDNYSTEQLEEIIGEAADVGNFAMMIADLARRELDLRIEEARKE